jgi:hypothetical protein
MKMVLLTNATVVDYTIRFVNEHQRQVQQEVKENNNIQTRDKSVSTIMNQMF